MTQHPSYYARRAQDERRMAAPSTDPMARKAHLKLAALAGEDPDKPEVQDAVAERLFVAAAVRRQVG